jgi:hypothetical protein
VPDASALFPAGPPSALEQAVVEVERHVAAQGWDAPPRLFALVPTVDLLTAEPSLAEALAGAGALTPVEQEDLPSAAGLEGLLGGIAWPDEVVGAAIVAERLMLPPEVEAAMPREDEAALAWLASHPQRQEVRLAVGVLRDGSRASVVRLRAHDDDLDVLVGPDLVPRLADALAETLR